MAAEASRSSSSADSYIGSLISLTSKSDIRYEGVLYNINTVESSIGLRNVRSFGTEGRKKDGPQVPASDKIYEYILFRGSDIKDLQVKASPPLQPTPTINNDPAIIQSHYPLVASTGISLPTSVTESLLDNGSHSVQMPHLGSTFPGNLPLYQPGGNTGSWAPSQPLLNANASGIALPMYWQGYYGLPNAHPSFTQQSLLRPPPGLSLPPPIHQHQYPGLSGSLPGASALTGSNISEYPTILPSSTNSLDLPSISLPTHHPSSITPFPTTTLASETLPSLIPNRGPNSALPASSLGTNLLSFSALASFSQDANIGSLPTSIKPNAVSAVSLPYQALSQPMPLVFGTSVPNHVENPTPSLVTPGQLLQSLPATVSSAQSLHGGHKDVEVVRVPSTSSAQASSSKSTQLSSSTSGKQVSSTTKEAQPPILPLPVPSRAGQKFNGVQYHGRNDYRGRERGRGLMDSRATARFTEDFDFTAMNEKFNKDEVWGHLGKSSKSHSRAKEEDGNVDDEDEYEDEDNYLLPNMDMKPMYNKDDFFDTISCNSLDHGGRTRFSEQMKIDTETFGDFPRYRGGRGRWGHRGGGRSRGGSYGRGYGNFGRGRGRRGQ